MYTYRDTISSFTAQWAQLLTCTNNWLVLTEHVWNFDYKFSTSTTIIQCTKCAFTLTFAQRSRKHLWSWESHWHSISYQNNSCPQNLYVPTFSFLSCTPACLSLKVWVHSVVKPTKTKQLKTSKWKEKKNNLVIQKYQRQYATRWRREIQSWYQNIIGNIVATIKRNRWAYTVCLLNP